MTRGVATAFRDALAAQFEREIEATHRVISAIPEIAAQWRPHPAGNAALGLAWHVVESETALLDAATRADFAGPTGSGPAPATIAGLAALYRERATAALARLRVADAVTLARPVVFSGITRPAVEHLLFALGHTAHHRGQLTAYLRAMGARVPGVYGKSADERG
jgi:uncharacterized damage-inducible protein DinB